MHELAIAQRLIDGAVAQLPTDAAQIVQLRVQLGALAGLSKDELAFGFEAMSKQTPCAGARLEIEETPAVVHCPNCIIDFSAADASGLLCPNCGSPAVLVLEGKELLLTSMEYQEMEYQEIERTASEFKELPTAPDEEIDCGEIGAVDIWARDEEIYA
jgi:hydrogenase nickel incorporation protein HypA/HybF